MEWEFSLDNIHGVAKECWLAIGDKKVVAFHGEMGAGKTTFIHAMSEAIGVKNSMGSPTFSIINEYEYDCAGTKRQLFHLDLYRLKDNAEAIQAGVEDVLFSGNVCMVEWPEKAPGVFPVDTLHLYIESARNGMRLLKIADN